MSFINDNDYQVVIGETALKVISQVSAEVRSAAELQAQAEIAAYLNPKYDSEKYSTPRRTSLTSLSHVTRSSSCTLLILRSITCRLLCPERWDLRYARSDTSVQSSGLKGSPQGRLFPPDFLWLLSPRPTVRLSPISALASPPTRNNVTPGNGEPPAPNKSNKFNDYVLSRFY